ncbi:MAG TPA: type II toxin-antitoxin system VapC family toxin [Geodermatophilus sp.]|nr:type II toxin-antitoxin system VapC family toxin [Geodermatophilus sp.]
MRVLDAGVVVDLLVGRLDDTALAGEEAGVPHLLDSEVTNVLRRLVLRGDLTVEQGDAAMSHFLELDLERFPADRLRVRMWDLRENLTAYDATYVALAEAVGATALLTTDARLAGAPGIRCTVRVV